MFGVPDRVADLDLSGGKKPQQEQDRANEQKKAKQNLGNTRCRAGDSGESQQGGNNGYYQEHECPS